VLVVIHKRVVSTDHEERTEKSTDSSIRRQTQAKGRKKLSNRREKGRDENEMLKGCWKSPWGLDRACLDQLNRDAERVRVKLRGRVKRLLITVR
jgi:hypothetical protein